MEPQLTHTRTLTPHLATTTTTITTSKTQQDWWSTGLALAMLYRRMPGFGYSGLKEAAAQLYSQVNGAIAAGATDELAGVRLVYSLGGGVSRGGAGCRMESAALCWPCSL